MYSTKVLPRELLQPPKVNQRIKVIVGYWFGDMQCVPVKARGKIIKVFVEQGQTLPTIHVKMDGDGYGLPDGIMRFYPQSHLVPREEGEPEKPDQTILSWFYHHCEVTSWT
jgi:hypothetical protein